MTIAAITTRINGKHEKRILINRKTGLIKVIRWEEKDGKGETDFK